MISWLKAVIARLLGRKAEHSAPSVQPTQTAGHVNQEPTTKRGSKRSALATEPVQTEQKPKRSRARQTTQEASPKPARISAKRTAIQDGSQAVTPAFPIPQPAPTPTKKSRKRAGQTK